MLDIQVRLSNNEVINNFQVPVPVIISEKNKEVSLACMSPVMRKPAFWICENKGADQLRGYRTDHLHIYCAAGLCLCFRIYNIKQDCWWRSSYDMIRVMRKPTFCICENKDADQLRNNREADQCLCFPYIDSAIPLLSKCEISSL